MQFKQFCTKHEQLLKTVCWAIVMVAMSISLIYIWAEPAIAKTDPVPPQIKMEPTMVATTSGTDIIPSATPEPTPVLAPRYGFTDDDIYLMTVLLCGSKKVDGDGEFDFDFGRKDEYDQISLVLCVVMNRVRSDLFPDTVSGVIWQKGQFSGMYRWKNKLPQVSDASLQRVTDWCKAYDAYDVGAQSIPEEHLYFCGNGKVNRSR